MAKRSFYSYFTKSLNTKLLAIMVVLLVAWIVSRLVSAINREKEGFAVPIFSKKYEKKENDAVFDSAYAPVFDIVTRDDERLEFERSVVDEIIESKKNPKVLDLCSRTGNFLSVAHSSNPEWHLVGIEPSRDFVNASKEKLATNRSLELLCSDPLSPMSAKMGQFDVITLLYFSVYYFDIEQKRQLFQNCHRWLAPDGKLVLHLVNRTKFDTLIDLAMPINLSDYNKKRITDSVVKFNDLDYKAKFGDEKLASTSVATFRETMKDRQGHIRENEHVFYMEKQRQILDIAQECGFVIDKQYTLSGDANQFIYVLGK
jgi:SAM-dependent methyltransferase